jgi:hypothetical protein
MIRASSSNASAGLSCSKRYRALNCARLLSIHAGDTRAEAVKLPSWTAGPQSHPVAAAPQWNASSTSRYRASVAPARGWSVFASYHEMR